MKRFLGSSDFVIPFVLTFIFTLLAAMKIGRAESMSHPQGTSDWLIFHTFMAAAFACFLGALPRHSTEWIGPLLERAAYAFCFSSVSAGGAIAGWTAGVLFVGGLPTSGTEFAGLVLTPLVVAALVCVSPWIVAGVLKARERAQNTKIRYHRYSWKVRLVFALTGFWSLGCAFYVPLRA